MLKNDLYLKARQLRGKEERARKFPIRKAPSRRRLTLIAAWFIAPHFFFVQSILQL
jgi:hypothetical protein